MKILSLTGLAAAGLVVFASAAMAQGKPAPAPAEPYNKKIGDWVITCTTVASPNPCQMTQGVAEKNTGQQLLSISFLYIPSADQNGMIIVVPLGVSITSGLVLKTDAFTSAKLPYDHCDRNGCYAELPIPKDTVQAMGRTSNAQVQIAADDGKVIPLRLSLNGFAEAHDAMAALAKQKAGAPAPAVINGAQ